MSQSIESINITQLPRPETEYTLIETANIESFQDQVNRHLSQGWELYGGVTSSGSHYLREMIRTFG